MKDALVRWWFRRRAKAPDCPQCGHTWDEHAGGSADPDSTDPDCGECQYELEHGYMPAGAELCRLRAFNTRVQALPAEVHTQLIDHGGTVRWVAPFAYWHTARVEVGRPGEHQVALWEDEDRVYAVIDHHRERLLTADEEAQLVKDPGAFLAGLAGVERESGADRGGSRPVVPHVMAEHAAAAFPARLRGQDVAGVDAVMVDADITGLVSTWLNSGQRLTAGQERHLVALMADLESVLAQLREPDEVAYYRRLRAMARAVHRP